jgi:hypothetical protein
LRAYQAVTEELAQARYLGPWKGPEGVRGHAFERSGQPVLVVWTPSADGKIRIDIKTSASKLSLRTVANEKSEVVVKESRAAITVSHDPVFVAGLNKAELGLASVSTPSASPPASPRDRLPGVWFSVLPPSTTARPFLALGGYNELPLRIHNDGRERARGELKIELTGPHGPLGSGRLAFDVAPAALETVVWRSTLPPAKGLAGELGRLRVDGLANGQPLAPIDLPVRLVRSKAIEFAANSFVERQYLHKAAKSGCSDSVRFGSEFGYRFDLRNMRSAELRINVGANAANPWNVLVSRDDQNYILERSGESWPSWQAIPLDKYLTGTSETPGCIYVKIQGTDCQVREVVLESEQ